MLTFLQNKVNIGAYSQANPTEHPVNYCLSVPILYRETILVSALAATANMRKQHQQKQAALQQYRRRHSRYSSTRSRLVELTDERQRCEAQRIDSQ